MTQPDVPEESRDQYDFDVAISFAAEDREYAEEFARALRAKGVSVFYDEDYTSETWGENLLEYFDAIYRIRSRFAVLFLSSHYKNKMWPRHERRSALARALQERTAYVLPVRLDDSEIEGLNPTIGYIDARRIGLSGLVESMISKLHGNPSGNRAIDRVPRTEAERQLLLLERPPGWEYLLLAAQLLVSRSQAESIYRDHQLRYAPPAQQFVGRADVFRYLDRALNEAQQIVESLNRLMYPEAQERAFGPSGTPGDADLIIHLANRWNSVYVDLINWASRVRGTTCPQEVRQLFELAAQLVDESIDNYRSFVDGIVEQADLIPARLASGLQIKIEATATFSVSDSALAKYKAEFARVRPTFR